MAHPNTIPRWSSSNRDGTFKPVGPLEDILPVMTEEEREAAWRPDEDGWETL